MSIRKDYHWSNKNYVEDWTKTLPYNCSVNIIGRGCKVVHLYVFGISKEEFYKKYPSFETPYCKGWLTVNGEFGPFYVSIKKK